MLGLESNPYHLLQAKSAITADNANDVDITQLAWMFQKDLDILYFA